MKKVIIIVIVLVVLFLGGRQVIKSKAAGQDNKTKVKVEVPEVGELVESIQAPGGLKPLTSVTISAKITGKIIALPYDEGDKVYGLDSGNEPSVLVKIDSSDLEADLESAQARYDSQVTQLEISRIGIENSKASLQNTEISLKQSKRDLVRYRELLKTNDVKESDVENMEDEVAKLELALISGRNSIETSELNLKIMENNLTAAKASIDKVKDALTYAVISSPIDGVVTKVQQEVGQIVTGATNYTGTPILQVADLSKMLMAAQIDEVDVGKVKVGQKAIVKIQAWPDEEFAGEVTGRSLIMESGRSGTKYCEVEITLDNEDGRIISGMSANAEIEIEVHKDVMKVPSQAVLGREWSELPEGIKDEAKEYIDEDKPFCPVVYYVEDGKTKVKAVKIGPSDLTHTIVEQGLNGDEEIVTGPFKELEGMRHDREVEVEKKDEEKEGEGVSEDSSGEGSENSDGSGE